jgi:hypothetical protein
MQGSTSQTAPLTTAWGMDVAITAAPQSTDSG